MKQVQAETGGRPFANDDLVVMQQELLAAMQAQFLNKGAFIVSGCYVSGPASGATVTPGIVLLDGQLLRYEGGSGVTLPAQLQAGAVVYSDPRPYETGGTKYCAREVPAVLVAANAGYTGGEYIALDTWGGKRWEHVQQAAVRSPGEVMWVASLATGDYDASGVGKPGSEAWGWALCDGQNGRADLRGRFVAGLDVNQPDYNTIGNTGGAEAVTLTVPQLPAHTHRVNYQKTDSQLGGDGGLDFTRFAAGHPNARPGNTSADTEAQGSGQAHENRPPYYVLAARQWVGF